MVVSVRVPKKMIEYGQVSAKGSGEYRKSGHIRASAEKMIESRQVPEKGLGEYRKSDRIQANAGDGSNMGKYRKRVRASTGRVIESERMPKK